MTGTGSKEGRQMLPFHLKVFPRDFIQENLQAIIRKNGQKSQKVTQRYYLDR